ncbi:MAG: sugar phosphate isomerase/epimerase [Protaetiibacter sp.]
MKLGYNTWSMPTLSYEESVALLAGLGFDSLELTVCEGWPTDAVLAPAGQGAVWRRMADDAGIDVSSVTANVPIIVDDGAWPAVLERLVRSFDLAAELQHPGQRMPVSLGALLPIEPGAGHRMPEGGDALWERHRRLIVDRFGELAERAAAREVRVALESHVGAVVSRPERALAVLEGVGSEHLGLNLDISHYDVQGMDVREVVRQLGPHAIVSEVKDELGVEPDFEFLIPGEGAFDYAGFVRAMDEAGYSDSIAVEISVMRQNSAIRPFDPVEAARQSYRVLSDAFEKAGVVRPVRDRHEEETR